MSSIKRITLTTKDGRGRPVTRWRARWRDPDGRSMERRFATKDLAQRHLERVGASIQSGTYVDRRLGRTSVGEFAERWLKAKANLKRSTRSGYASILRAHVLPRFGRRALNSLTLLDVQEFVASLQASGLSPARVRRVHQVLHSVLEWSVAANYLPRNPATAGRRGAPGVQLPRAVSREMAFLDHGEVERLAAVIAQPYGTLVLVLGYAGLRWGEAVALRRGRCDLLRSQLRITESASEAGGLHFGSTKNYRSRTVDLPQFLVEALAVHLESTPDRDPGVLVFQSSGGGPLRHSNFAKRVWKPAVAEAGITPVTPHGLRHTFAAFLIDEGANPLYVKNQMGHSSITVTMDRYGHLFPTEAAKVTGRLDAARRSQLVGFSWASKSGEVRTLPIKGL